MAAVRPASSPPARMRSARAATGAARAAPRCGRPEKHGFANQIQPHPGPPTRDPDLGTYRARNAHRSHGEIVPVPAARRARAARASRFAPGPLSSSSLLACARPAVGPPPRLASRRLSCERTLPDRIRGVGDRLVAPRRPEPQQAASISPTSFSIAFQSVLHRASVSPSDSNTLNPVSTVPDPDTMPSTMSAHMHSRRRRAAPAALPRPALVQTLATGPHRIVCLAWSPSGHYLAAALQHGAILIFATQPSSSAPLRPLPVRSLKGHTADVVHLAFSPSNLLASASIDRSARLWQPATALCLRRLPHTDKVVSVAFDAADPSVILTATASGQTRLVRASDRTILARADAQTPLHAAAMLPGQGAHAAAVLAARDGRLLVWRPQTAVATPTDRLQELPFEPRRPAIRRDRAAVPPSVAQLPGGKVLLSNGARRAVLSADGLSRRVRAGAPAQGLPLAPGMSAEGRFSLVDASGGAVRVLDGGASVKRSSSREVAGSLVEIPALRRAAACCAAFAPDAVCKRFAKRVDRSSFLLAVGGSDGSIALVEQSYL